jgi:lipoprotein NlpD
MWRYLSLMMAVTLAACSNRPPVPVSDGRAPVPVERGVAPAGEAPTVAREGYYVVKRGDTLRRIAQTHGLDYRDVAAWNNMTDPSRIEVGQELRVMPPEGVAIVKPIEAPAPLVVVGESGRPVASSSDSIKREPRGGKIAYSESALAEVRAMEGGAPVPALKPAERPTEKPAAPPVPAATAEAVDWTWPAAGKVISEFVEGGNGKESNKGIDFAGRMGEPIQAAAAGKVTYVGSLRGYGDFLVVRHNNDFISVYAHTSKILVKKDQAVTKGQKIAEVGSSDADQPKLHFEIRQQSRPVDPLKFLPAR